MLNNFEDKIFILGGIFGLAIGSVAGYESAGIGGAILWGLLGGFIGFAFVGGLILTFIEYLPIIILILLIIGFISAIIWAITTFWGVY